MQNIIHDIHKYNSIALNSGALNFVMVDICGQCGICFFKNHIVSYGIMDGEDN